jgi:hypothetical protein
MANAPAAQRSLVTQPVATAGFGFLRRPLPPDSQNLDGFRAIPFEEFGVHVSNVRRDLQSNKQFFPPILSSGNRSAYLRSM